MLLFVSSHQDLRCLFKPARKAETNDYNKSPDHNKGT